MDEYQSLIGGEWRSTNERYELKNPYNQELIAVVSRPGPEEALEAVERADRAFEATRAMPSWKRAEILQAIAEGIKARHEELSRTIALEA
ncbi:aldehyde dehydrogenase family protein, partial [Nitrospinae bacterium AH_259_B05_G02_I21]|nr:aldehyde dehydrogenase family protein [Nitrospinae bacterium AH_259_B05_G02_I21]